MTRPPDTIWMDHAWCARVPDLPWRADTEGVPGHLVRQMSAICAACPVREPCAAYVADTDVRGGFWAGHDRALPVTGAVDDAGQLRFDFGGDAA